MADSPTEPGAPEPEEPSTRRKIVSGIAVAIVAVSVWAFVEWRSAAPPPPGLSPDAVAPRR